MSAPRIGETWPVVTSPATGHPPKDPRDNWPLDIDVDQILEVLRRPLIDPPPLRDKALEET